MVNHRSHSKTLCRAPIVAVPDLLRVENLTKAFSGVEVLKNLTLGIRPGEILGVIGENGAGKSTFMKLISGVYSPTSGRILFDGQPVRIASPMVAQAPRHRHDPAGVQSHRPPARL